MTTPHPSPHQLPAQPAPALTRRELKAAQRHGRAGRNLPVAIGVGVALGAVVLLSLFVRKEAFVVVVAAAVCASLWALSTALAKRGVAVPLVPVSVGTVG